MRKLLIGTCLLATICAYHVKQNFDVVIESVEYTNVPPKLNLDKFTFPAETVEVLKNIVLDQIRPEPRAGTEANVDDYADKIFTNVDSALVHDGLDPSPLPDQEAGFNYTLIITYWGELDLTVGWLSDLSTMHRGGDVLVSYSTTDKYLEVTVPIAFDDLQFTYDYSAKIMGLGPTGGIAGKIADINVEIKIGFDATTLRASLDEFVITNSGHIEVDFNGNALIDWLINLLTNVVTALLKPLILGIVEGIIRDGVQSVIDAIDDAVSGIINPTTAAPAVAQTAGFF